MNTKIYNFYQLGVIPGIPGQWHSGQVVEVDTNTNTILDVRLRDAPITQEAQPVAVEETPVEDESQVITPQEEVDTHKE